MSRRQKAIDLAVDAIGALALFALLWTALMICLGAGLMPEVEALTTVPR